MPPPQKVKSPNRRPARAFAENGNSRFSTALKRAPAMRAVDLGLPFGASLAASVAIWRTWNDLVFSRAARLTLEPFQAVG